MNTHESTVFTDGFAIGHIVWARRDYDGLYWPARVTSVASHRLTTTGYSMYQPCSYLIRSFETNQTHWTADVLPYRSYRDYMSKYLLIHYQSDAHTIGQLSHAIHQADGQEGSMAGLSERSTALVTVKQNTHPATTENRSSTNDYSTPTINHSSTWDYLYGTSPASYQYCSCCPQPSHSSTSSSNNIDPQTQHFDSMTTMIIVTRRAYIYPSFLTYLLHSLHHFTHRSVFYIDDSLNSNNAPLPSTSTNITYLICLDQFHPAIQQMLDATVLHNLNAHINYCFLLLNAPSQRLISHVYETVMDKRLVLVLHYHSAFDDAPLLLCSGARETFEMVRGSVLQCLCVRVKYTDGPTSNDEQRYAPIAQPVPFPATGMVYASNATSSLGWSISPENPSFEDWSPAATTNNKHSRATHEEKKRESKANKTKHQRASSETAPECNVKNILNSADVSK